MSGRVSGEWGGIACDMICRNCVAMETYMVENDGARSFDTIDPYAGVDTPSLDQSTRKMVTDMNKAKSGVLAGRECMSPTKKYLVVGSEVCHAAFLKD